MIGRFALVFATGMLASICHADPAGELLKEIVNLHQTKVEGLEGRLLLDRVQFDKNKPSFVVYIGDRRYTAVLDDGRLSSENALGCGRDSLFPEPNAGCRIKFDGQYIVEDDGRIEVWLVIWNIQFLSN